MGRTNFRHREDEDSTRRGKHPKHSRNMPGRGMRVINSYDEDYYDDEPFDDELEIEDEIFITHTKNTR